jgi:hypothetical protein
MLCVLDPEATVARTILTFHPLEDAELEIDGAVTNRVYDDVQARFVGVGDPRVEILRRIDEQSAVARRICERLHHCRSVRAE